MGELVFIGLGLNDEMGISIRGVEEAKRADHVFAEFYTSIMSEFSLERLERIIGKRVKVLSRRDLEDYNGEAILERAVEGRVAFLVPGDPLIATTHIDLRIRAERMGIKTRVIHGSSIISAAMGLSNLQNYRFGRSVTIPFPVEGYVSEVPYHVIKGNKSMNLHTLCFLDVKAEEGRFLTINESLKILLSLEDRFGENIIKPESLAVGISRAGSENVAVKADYIERLIDYDFGGPPHTLIIPADKLHFMEAEALIALAGAPEKVKEMVK